MIYHLFLYGECDNPGGMGDYAGKFGTFDAILEYMIARKSTDNQGDVVQIEGDNLKVIARVNYEYRYGSRFQSERYEVVALDGQVLAERFFEQLEYGVDLPPGYYTTRWAGDQYVLVPITADTPRATAWGGW